MRYRISNYTINKQVINLYKEDGSDLNVIIEDIRLIINETKNKVICSSMQKDNVTIDNNGITVPEGICVLEDNDQLTIEIDKGEDLSEISKQGENPEATNTAILEAVSNIVDTKNLYSVRFENNDDGPNTYTMVLPVVAGVVGDTIIL